MAEVKSAPESREIHCVPRAALLRVSRTASAAGTIISPAQGPSGAQPAPWAGLGHLQSFLCCDTVPSGPTVLPLSPQHAQVWETEPPISFQTSGTENTVTM